MKVLRFEDLECFRSARFLTKQIYRLTKKKNFARDFKLIEQITGASISIMNNVVEGFDSQSNREFIKFLSYARRSTSEVQNCLYVAIDQNYIEAAEFRELYELARKTRKLIDGLLSYLRKHSKI